MELRQLEQFVAVAEERHFTRAAERVHVVQSTVSSSIRTLERELGVELVARTSRRVELTDAGRALLPEARRALAAAAAGRAAVDATLGLLRGRLVIGAIQGLGILDLPAALAGFHRAHPGVELVLRSGSVPELVAATIEGAIDLSVGDRPFDDRRCDVLPLGRTPLVLAVPRDDPLAGEQRVRLTTLAGRAFVDYRADSSLRATVDRAFADAGLTRSTICEAHTLSTVVELVAHGLGAALVPPVAVRPGDDVVLLDTDPAIVQDIAVVTARERPPSPAAAALLEVLPVGPSDAPGVR